MAWPKGYLMIYVFLYRTVMKIAHRFNWHYAPPFYPEGDTQLWCQWCGFRQTIKRRNDNYPDDYPNPFIVTEADGSKWVPLEQYERKYEREKNI